MNRNVKLTDGPSVNGRFSTSQLKTLQHNFIQRIIAINRSPPKVAINDRLSTIRTTLKSRRVLNAFLLSSPTIAPTLNTKRKALDADTIKSHENRIHLIKSTNAGRASMAPRPKSLSPQSAGGHKASAGDQAANLNFAINALAQHHPNYSSRHVLDTKQMVSLLCLIAIIAVVALIGLVNWFPVFLFSLSALYFGCVLLRARILADFEPQEDGTKLISLSAEVRKDLPVYSVLVALYREENQVGQLTKNLSNLHWPREKLDIKLICEADDTATIEAILHLQLPPQFQLVVVPHALPKTKPKALNYALKQCSGAFLVLYDAEDHPQPDQLLEAYQKFHDNPQALACLQAPLVIHNHNQSWLTAMFALEYRTLFSGVLPILAKWQAPMPLGGTSNHFRTHILRSVGGWDPYNVTEDADLGIRLAREGYRSGTISTPTYEEAPPGFSDWLPQRTRWLKGWMQTALVHSREPVRSVKQIGWKSYLLFHLLMTSVVISCLIHPIFLGLFIIQMIGIVDTLENIGGLLTVSSIFVLVGGYTTYGALAWLTLQHSRFRNLQKYLWTLPAYWMLLSLAGWRALYQLIVSPHHWEKTRHGLAKSPMDISACSPLNRHHYPAE